MEINFEAIYGASVGFEYVPPVILDEQEDEFDELSYLAIDLLFIRILLSW